MQYKNGQILKVENALIDNQVGGNEILKTPVQVKVTDSFYDEETGERYIGELFRKEDIQASEKLGKSDYTPEDYREFGEIKYLETLEKYKNYNPKKVYFSEFDVIK